MSGKITTATLALLLLAMSASCEQSEKAATEPEAATDVRLPTGPEEVHFYFHMIELNGVSNVSVEYPPAMEVQDTKDRAFFSVIVEGGGGLTVSDRVATTLGILQLQRDDDLSEVKLDAWVQTDSFTEVGTAALRPGKYILTIAKSVTVKGKSYPVVAGYVRPTLPDPYKRVFFAESRPAVLMMFYNDALKELVVIFSEHIKLDDTKADAVPLTAELTADKTEVATTTEVRSDGMTVRLPKDFDASKRLTLQVGDVVGKSSNVPVIAASRTLEIIPAEHETAATAWIAGY